MLLVLWYRQVKLQHKETDKKREREKVWTKCRKNKKERKRESITTRREDLAHYFSCRQAKKKKKEKKGVG